MIGCRIGGAAAFSMDSVRVNLRDELNQITRAGATLDACIGGEMKKLLLGEARLRWSNRAGPTPGAKTRFLDLLSG